MMDFDNVLTLIQKELRDAIRNRWFMLYTGGFTILTLALSWLALSGVGRLGFSGLGRTGASMINLVLLIVPLMGLTLGAMALAAEKERGALLYLLAQPVNTLEVLIGKYLGLALSLMLTLAGGFGLSALLIAWQGGNADMAMFLTLVGLALLLALVCLSLGFLVSALSKRSATAQGVALFLWLALVFFADLGVMGTAIVLKLDASTLLGLALANPLQTFKIASVLNLQSNLEILGPAGLYATRTFGSQLMPLLIAMLGLWIISPLGMTYLVFRKRGGF